MKPASVCSLPRSACASSCVMGEPAERLSDQSSGVIGRGEGPPAKARSSAPRVVGPKAGVRRREQHEPVARPRLSAPRRRRPRFSPAPCRGRRRAGRRRRWRRCGASGGRRRSSRRGPETATRGERVFRRNSRPARRPDRLERRDRLRPPVLLHDEVVAREAQHGLPVRPEDDHVDGHQLGLRRKARRRLRLRQEVVVCGAAMATAAAPSAANTTDTAAGNVIASSSPQASTGRPRTRRLTLPSGRLTKVRDLVTIVVPTLGVLGCLSVALLSPQVPVKLRW